MNTGTLSGILTLLVLIAFIGIVFWAYSKRRKRDFDEAANLPFADDDEQPNRDDSASANETHSRHDRGDDNT